MSDDVNVKFGADTEGVTSGVKQLAHQCCLPQRGLTERVTSFRGNEMIFSKHRP